VMRLIAGVLRVTGAQERPFSRLTCRKCRLRSPLRNFVSAPLSVKISFLSWQAKHRSYDCCWKAHRNLPEGLIENIGEIRAMCVVAGDAVVLPQRAMHEFGILDLRLDIRKHTVFDGDFLVMTAQAQLHVGADEKLILFGCVRQVALFAALGFVHRFVRVFELVDRVQEVAVAALAEVASLGRQKETVLAAMALWQRCNCPWRADGRNRASSSPWKST